MPALHRGRFATTLTLAAVTAVSLAACSSGGGATPSTSAGGSAPASSAAASVGTSDACSSSQDSSNTFALGTFLPLTGSLAFLGPAAVGASGLAIQDINKAGGVNGKDACTISVDSSDTDNATIGQTNIKKLLQAKVSGILGAESSSVTENVLPTVSAQKTVMFSPANTDDALSGASDWYFRNAPKNGVEGTALGNQIVADGFSKTGILVFNDAYGTNLRDGVEAALKSAGGSVVYGAKGKNQEFASTETNFSSAVNALKATNPDSIVVIAFDQTKQIIPAMVSAGIKLNSTYFVDGNLADYTGTFPANTLTGVKGATQGVNPTADLKKNVQAWYTANGGGTIGAFGYAAESYDAVTLMALAAQKGGDNSPATIQKNLRAVSGSNGGTVCKSFAGCVALLKQNKDIHYEGLAGTGPLNAAHDPSSGYISIYQYKGNNPSEFVNSVKVNIPG